MNSWKKVLTYAVIIGLAVVSAVNYQLFIFPNRFAPSGLNGLCTMVQYVFGIRVSSLNLLINLPLALLVYKKVSQSIALRSMIYVLSFSLALSAIIRRYPNAYAVMSSVSEVMGNFKHLDNEGKVQHKILDSGDTPAV